MSEEANKNSRELRRIIRETLEREYAYIFEGIDIDKKKRIISFNNSHENNVDTSVLLNPTFYSVNGIDVISIFKRKASFDSNLDGNPLVYALKDINGWKFKNPQEDIIGLLKNFIRIAEKIKTNYDTIITIPSNNELNLNFLHRLNKIIKADYQITDYIFKKTSEDVYENYVDWGRMERELGSKFDVGDKELTDSFSEMERNNDGVFSFKFIKDVNLRKYITRTMYSDNKKTIDYATQINGKDILILDDTIASGASISNAADIILSTFTPKSVTVITLFSPLSKK